MMTTMLISLASLCVASLCHPPPPPPPWQPDEAVKILVSGHSLGGALASLAATEIAVGHLLPDLGALDVRLTTFGSPRVGNRAFVEFASKVSCHLGDFPISAEHQLMMSRAMHLFSSTE